MITKDKLNLYISNIFIILLGLFFVVFSFSFSYELSFFRNYLLIILVVFCILFFYFNFKIGSNLVLKTNLSKKNHLIIFVTISIISFLNIFLSIGNLPFHQDEQFHFSPAFNFGKTGDFAKWDFLYDDVGSDKWTDRNQTLTVFSSITQDIFGFSEFSSRLPVAIMGFIGLFLIYFITFGITKNKIISLISMYIYSVNDTILYFSSFLRGYIFLIVFSLSLFYFLYLLLNSISIRDKITYFLFSFILFVICLFEIHGSIIVFLPLIFYVYFIVILKTFNFKKYIILYIVFFFLSLIFLLNALGIIHLFKMPFGIQGQINLDFDFFKLQKVYLSHVTNGYNLGYALIFLLFNIFFINISRNIKIFFVLGFLIPILFSLYFFNRYEDFRYISLLQGIFIFYLSIFVYYSWGFISNIYKINYNFLVLFLFIFIPLQFPYLPQLKPITLESKANWQNIEGSRIHFRAAQPDNEKAFDYLFKNYKSIVLLRLADGGINWDDNYYLSTYISKYNPENFVYYSNIEKTKLFNEVYNSKKTKNNLIINRDFFNILDRYREVIVIGSVRDLIDKEMMNYFDTNCKNISKDIGIVNYRIFEYAHPKDNFFPNVFICQKK